MRIRDWSSDVCSSDLTPQTWIDIGHAWHGKGDDVHQQYAHNRKAAHGIKRKEARASGHCSLVTLFGGAAKGRRISVSLEESCDLLHGSDDGEAADGQDQAGRTDEQTSELQSLMPSSYAA